MKKVNTSLRESNLNLTETGQKLKELKILINDFKEFDFPQKSDKISYMKQVRIFETKSNEAKSEYDTLTSKILNQNKIIIDSNRESKFSGGESLNQGDFQKLQIGLMQGSDLLSDDQIQEKQRQSSLIEKYNF